MRGPRKGPFLFGINSIDKQAILRYIEEMLYTKPKIKVRAKENIFVAGKPISVGDVFETDAHTARLLVFSKRAAYVSEQDKELVDITAQLENHSPAPKGRKTK